MEEISRMSKMTKMTAVALAAGMLVGTASLKAAEVTVGSDVVSSYVWRGITLNADPVVQPSIDVAHPSGFGINVWGNFDLGDDDGVYYENEFSEIDLTLSYTLDLEGVEVTVGYIEYTYPGGISDVVVNGDDVTAFGAKADREVFVGLGTEIAGLGLGLTVYQSARSSDATYANLGAEYSIDLVDGVSLGLSAAIGYGTKGATAGGKSGMHEYQLGASLGFSPIENLELGAFVYYVDSLDSDVLPNEAIREDVFGGVSLYYSF